MQCWAGEVQNNGFEVLLCFFVSCDVFGSNYGMTSKAATTAIIITVLQHHHMEDDYGVIHGEGFVTFSNTKP